MNKIKKQIKPFLITNVLLFLFAFIFRYWIEQTFLNNKLINGLGMWLPVILCVIYCFIFSRVNLGKWVITFFIPIFPYLLYDILIQGFWYNIFPDPFPNGEDNAAEGILVVGLSVLHYLVICLAIIINFVVKKWVKKTKLSKV